MVKEGKYHEALEIIMEDLPLPGVLGRICPHGCEDACRRAEKDQAVAIRNLKRLAADRVDPRELTIPCAPPRAETVAIIGSGPAGLSCAYHLARKNEVELFKRSMQIAAVVGCFAAIMVAVNGHSQAQHMVETQPMKMAAAEALWETEDPASFSLLTITLIVFYIYSFIILYIPRRWHFQAT